MTRLEEMLGTKIPPKDESQGSTTSTQAELEQEQIKQAEMKAAGKTQEDLDDEITHREEGEKQAPERQPREPSVIFTCFSDQSVEMKVLNTKFKRGRLQNKIWACIKRNAAREYKRLQRASA